MPLKHKPISVSTTHLYLLDELTSSSSLPNVSRSQLPILTVWLMYDISVDRFSPHVIASEFSTIRDNSRFYAVPQISSSVILMKTTSRSAHGLQQNFIFFNSLQTQIFYANNATNVSADTALTTSWIGPSITPLTNLNSGFRVYEVDSAVRVAPLVLNSLPSFLLKCSPDI
jgi:hypothetical protein